MYYPYTEVHLEPTWAAIVHLYWFSLLCSVVWWEREVLYDREGISIERKLKTNLHSKCSPYELRVFAIGHTKIGAREKIGGTGERR